MKDSMDAGRWAKSSTNTLWNHSGPTDPWASEPGGRVQIPGRGVQSEENGAAQI